ncbi:MAG: hypothetical protein P4L73_07930 [Caulobacteraceae bacterium]|nr:hypothetical protein [Caulobacteraceae bacterium]
MSIETLKFEVSRLLAEVKDQIREAEKARAGGAGADRVHAAGDLVILRRQRAELEARVAELDHCREGPVDTFVQWVREDWMILMHRLESWIEAR